METPLPGSKRVPERIGRYRVVSRLGKGAMGVVYSAYDDVMERSVAIKVMMADLEDDPDTATRFFREAHAAGQLVHRNIITIFDLGDDNGRPYIVMELLEGQMLGEYLKRPEGVPLEEKVSLMLQTCDGLRLAHGKGIFHRDIKPGNLHVTNAGDLKILDFGIARLATSSMTISGLIVGTPDYMSPEQACGREVDQRSDIFSAGAVFYLMLTGRKPFAAHDLPAVLMKVQNEDPLPIRESEAPPQLAAAVMKAMAKSPQARYQRVSELMADLARVSRELALETHRLSEQARRHLDAADALTAERRALLAELGVSGDADRFESFHEMLRCEYPAVAAWQDGGMADPLYRAVAHDLVGDVTSVRQSLVDETSGLRQALADLQAGTVAARAQQWVRAVDHFDAVVTVVPACARAREEAARLRRLLADRQEADDRRRALLAEAKSAAERAEWTAVITLADEVLATDRANAEAGALREGAAAALTADARRRRQACEQAIEQAEQLARKGRYAEAERAIGEARNIDSDTPGLIEAAQRIRLAALEAERGSERDRRAAAAIAAARAGFNQGAREAAIADLREFVAGNPDAASVQVVLDELTAEAERLAAAERRRAEAAEQARAAEAAFNGDNPDEALALAEQALRLDAQDALALRIQGLATARIRERKAAQERQKQADELLQGARTFLQRGKYGTARHQAHAAARLAPSDARVHAVLADIDAAEAKAREDERREQEARQRSKAAAPVLALAKAADAAKDYARAGWLAENALALDPASVDARQILERTHAKLTAEPELADDTVTTGATNGLVDIEDTVTLVPALSAWQRFAGRLRSWVPSRSREGV